MPFFPKKTDSETFEHTIDRYYYTSQQRFEQSIDVYKPLYCKSSSATKNERPSKIPVVLVMGSGWLGHKSYFYAMTNWWNSSAPKQICGRLGHPCISVRHSGGYLLGKKDRQIPTFLQWLFWKPFLVGAVAAGISAVFTGALRFPTFNIFILPLFMLVFFYVEGIGAAGIEDMVSDVSAALSYIDDHAHEWGLGGVAENQEMDKTTNRKKIEIVFGGYSSGAHVAATLLMDLNLSPLSSSKSSPVEKTQRFFIPSESDPQKSTKHHSNQPKHLAIRSVLYISGVLDVSPESIIMTILSRTVLRKSPLEVPSPLRTLTKSPSLFSDKPFCNFPPHVLIGCKHEVFGWSILDSAFCASKYADALRTLSIRTQSERKRINDASCNEDEQRPFVRLILLENWTVNHWSILSSAALRNALNAVLAPVDDRDTISS